MNSGRFKTQILILAGWLVAAGILCGVLFSRSVEAAEADALPSELADVVVIYRSEGAAKALPEFQDLRAAYRERSDKRAEAHAQRYVGECFWRLGQFEDSRAHLNKALELSRSTAQRALEGRTLNVTGLLDWDEGKFSSALDHFSQAGAIATELDDLRLAASTLNNRGLVKDETGDYDGSLADFEASLTLFKQENDRRGQSDALGNIGGHYLLLGRFPRALEFYEQALVISTELGDPAAMTIDHGNIALSLLGTGQVERSLVHFDQALLLATETGMLQEEAYWQRGKGNALLRQGRYDLGLELHRAALRTYEETGALGLLLDAQHDMGLLMLSLGDPVSAEKWFVQAAKLAREIGQERAVTENLLALGDLELSREQFELARAHYLEGLNRANQAGERHLSAVASLQLARLSLAQGHTAEAVTHAEQSLQIARSIGSGPLSSEAWLNLGEARRAEHALSESLAAFEQALVNAGNDPELLWQIHHGRALSLEQSGKTREAVQSLQAAVLAIESVRNRLREERFRAGWVEDKYQVYIDLVRLQIELGKTHDAFSTAERLRARSFLAQLEDRPVPARSSLARQQESLLRERIHQLQSALDAEQRKADPDRRQLAIETFSEELNQAEREYLAFLDDRGDFGTLPTATRLPSIEQIQRKMDQQEALVEYVVGNNELVIFVLRPADLHAVRLPLKQDELATTIALLRELIRQPGEQRWWPPAVALAESLLVPLKTRGLLDGVSHLSLVPHGVLNYLPFALLPVDVSGNRVLVEDFTLSYLPAAAALVHSSGVADTRRSLLAIAPARSRLKHAPTEARSVAAMFEPNSQLLIGENATESAFKSGAPDYQVLHLATHGVFNRQNPLLSGLELESDAANDGLLEVHEIMELSLDAELVTLSACQTGLGSGWFNDFPAGDDFVGLTRAFLAAGSRSVLATLWEVDDRSTLDLMGGFYRHLESEAAPGNRAGALAGVQRSLRRSEHYNHPFYWAPFVLVGQPGTPTNKSPRTSS